MKRNVLAAISVAAAALFATPASADVVHFAGTATGCFGAACTPPAWTFLGTTNDASLLYTNGQFSQNTDANGHLSIGGTSDNLGVFNLGLSDHDYNGDIFKLLVTFTAPPGTAPGSTLLQTMLEGIVSNSSTGGVSIHFNDSPHQFSYDGGSFTFQANNVDISSFSAAQLISGTIRAVPEPATWAMMLMGFAGMGMAMRRRRTPALAQIA